MRSVLQIASMLAAMVVVGTVFGIWFGFAPHSLSPAGYVEMQQQMIRALNVKMPLLGGVTIALTAGCAYLARKDRRALWLLGTAAAFFVVMGLVTRFLNQPINAIVIGWTPSAPPPEWEALRDSWWRYHMVRTIAGVVGFSLLAAGLLRSRSTQEGTPPRPLPSPPLT